MKLAVAIGSYFIVVLASVGFTAGAQATDQQAANQQAASQRVRVGIYQNQPKVFVDQQGEPAGFWVDILAEVAKAEGWSLEYVPCEWNACLSTIEQGQLDLMMDVAYSRERDLRFDFNQEVVLASWSQIYTRPGNTINSILDLEQRRVAVLRGSIQQTVLKEKAKAFDINLECVEVASFDEMFQRINSGDVDAGIVNNFYGQFASAEYRAIGTNVLINPVRLHFIAPTSQSRELLTALDRHLKTLKADSDSVYYEAKSRWLEPPNTFSWADLRRILVGAVVYVPVVALVVSVIWNHSLRQEIDRRKQAESRLQALTDNLPGVIYRYLLHPDGSDKLLYISSGCADLMGVSAETAIQNMAKLWELVHPEELPHIKAAVQRSAQHLTPWDCEGRIITPTGPQKWLHASARPHKQPNGDVIWDGLILDVTQQKQAELALRESENRLQTISDNIPGLLYGYRLRRDGSDQFTYISSGFRELYGFEPDGALQDTSVVWQIVHPDDLEPIRQSVFESYQKMKTWQYEYRVITPAGELKWLQAIARPTLQANGDVIWDGLVIDISDRIRAEQQLKHDVLHDRLTGLPNRSLLMERLELVLKRSRRNPELQFAVLFFDLDNFKVVNDSLGHLVGDELLLKVAGMLQRFIRETDLAARLGGDEFVLLLEELDGIDGAVRVARRILDALRMPLNISDREVFTSTSIGIVMGATNHSSAEDLLRDADLAMYRAKQAGKGRYAIFNPAMHFQVMQRLQLEGDLRKALENEEFLLYYQPIVFLETYEIQGFEALLRWQHPSRGLISPAEFITIAEETGLITEIGKWILKEACQQLAQWQARFPAMDLTISINLSARQIQIDLLQFLDEVLRSSGVAGKNLTLEITESILVQNLEATHDLLTQIKDRGVRFSIDDFGTGYSSLSYLHQLPVDALKIDRTFISSADYNARNQVITESIIALSNLLGLNAIAEGIETEQQLNWLRSLGCELGQGFLFSCPVPGAAATQLLRRRGLGKLSPPSVGTQRDDV